MEANGGSRERDAPVCELRAESNDEVTRTCRKACTEVVAR